MLSSAGDGTAATATEVKMRGDTRDELNEILHMVLRLETTEYYLGRHIKIILFFTILDGTLNCHFIY